ncbi:MAG: hypothetical protein DMF56_24235 [Acidobacteria bacterium]|nr:MAG: hypothetical protein DMF56_24235 [Acidobacteriota bacterium]
MRQSRVTVLLPVVFLLAAFRLGAEDRTLLVSGVFADSSIVGPVVRFTTGESSLTLLGGTLEGSWVKRQSARRGWLFSADVTPFNAQLSNRIYVEGERAHELEYEAASHRIRAGFRLTPNDRITTDIQLVGLLERITDIDDARVRSFWEGPFVGLDVSHAYQHLSTESPLIGSFNGFTAGARFEVFAGPETWSRVSIHQRSGIQLGKIHLRQSLLAMSGKNLNVVNRTLIGGSWDVLGETAMYGQRFGEYRVARGALANVGADYVLPRNWRVGVRGSYLRSDVADLYGTAINVSKIWKTFGFNAGVGKPQARNGKSDAVFYVAVIAPLYAK